MHYNTEKQFIIRVLFLDDLTKLSGFQITIYMLTTSQIIFLLSSLFWILESYPTSSLNCMANRNLKLTCPKQYWFTSPCPQTLSSHLFFPIISPIAISGNTLYSVGQVPKLQITLSSSHKPTNNRPSRLDNFTSKIYFFLALSSFWNYYFHELFTPSESTPPWMQESYLDTTFPSSKMVPGTQKALSKICWINKQTIISRIFGNLCIQNEESFAI